MRFLTTSITTGSKPRKHDQPYLDNSKFFKQRAAATQNASDYAIIPPIKREKEKGFIPPSDECSYRVADREVAPSYFQ